MKKQNYILISLTLIVLLNLFTPFDIKNEWVQLLLYLVVFVYIPFRFLFRILKNRNPENKISFVLKTFLIIGVFLTIIPVTYIGYTDIWKTQTILYQNKDYSFKKITFEMKDIGSFGYLKRKVEVTNLTPWFRIVTPFNTDVPDLKKWKKVAIDVNELELKIP